MRVAFLLVVLVLSLLIDLYVFQAVRTVTQSLTPATRKLIYIVYWSITALSFAAMILMLVIRTPFTLRTYLVAVLLTLFVSKLFVALLLLLEDGTRLVRWAMQQLSAERAAAPGPKITRSQFFSMAALILGALPFSALIYGMVRGAYHYQVRRVRLAFPNLPDAFNGYRFVQISDLHAGSFRSTEPLQRAVQLINKQQADLVVFTGDIVNNTADELEPHLGTLRGIKARDGVLSILGNHDYGEYVAWDNDKMKGANLDRLKMMQTGGLGWNLLVNSHHKISRNGQQIAFIGVENWSARGNFPKYGRLGKAVQGTEELPFKVLLSHDPSHWMAQVVKQHNIDLTLSGHTHGMQFGVRIPGFKWSPVQYVYDQWAGLYQQGKQFLYVNTGLGFLGYPGRVGIRPEITVIELVRG